ncbi:MAG: OmpH family outer membrane protein [Desulfovibrio sp.]|nr:OmpH family outer membrane protein [Desulfovibrio sp.]
MNKFVALLCIAVCCLFFACEQTKSASTVAPQKIGVVNINRLLVDSEPGRAAAKYMEDLQNALRSEATALQEKLQKVSEGEQGKSNTKKEEEQAALQKEIQTEYVRLQNKLQAEQQNVNNILNDVVHRTVDAFRKENGFSLIIFSDVVLSFEESIDVTSGVTKAMNKEKVEFKSVETKEPEKADTQQPPKEAPQKSKKENK